MAEESVKEAMTHEETFEVECLKGRGLQFHVSPDGNLLQAVYTPEGPVEPIDFAWIKNALDAQRLATGFYVSEHASGDLKKCYNEATDAFTLDIGEKRDGTFTITLSLDRMSATLTLSPPYAGVPVSSNTIRDNLTSAHIVSGIFHDRIESAIESGQEVANLLIAEGRPPVRGDDAQLVILVPELVAPVPVEFEESGKPDAACDSDDRDAGIADYRNISDIFSVKPGVPLMRRIPPTLGIPGEDVTGEPLAAEDGIDTVFADNLSGVILDPGDPDLLLAEVGGLPVLVDNGVSVEPVIKVKKVDLSTGNLYFEGSVEVEGNVREGMKLDVAGDVFVAGLVEAATIKCGGNVTVTGGVIGHGLELMYGDRLSERAIIQAQGTVSALFIENAVIESASDIEIKEVAMKSDLTASGQIVIGTEGTKKGHLIGGVCRARTRVKVVVAGSRASVHTRIEAGVEPTASERLEEVQVLIDSKERQVAEIEKDRVYCWEHPERLGADRCMLLDRESQDLQSAFAELIGQKKRLQRKLVPDPDACVEVERNIFQGVSVKIGERLLVVENDLHGGVFKVVGEDLVFIPGS